MARKRAKTSRFQNITSRFTSVGERIPVRNTYNKTVAFTQRRPVASFTVAIILLVAVIGIGNYLASPKPEPEVAKAAKSVSVYTLGKTPTVTLQAKIEKQGVIKITALSGGIVSSIPVTEGQTVQAGQSLVNLSSNYNGASLPGLQSALARTQYNNAVETYDTQKDLITKQREIAEKTRENTGDLREMSEDSLEDTRSLLDLNQTSLDDVNAAIEQLEAIPNPDAQQQASLASAEQARLQLQASVTQLRGSIRNLEYTVDEENPPTELAGIQKDITLKQLDLQQKALDLGKETSRLQYNIAAVGESLMHPSSPYAAVVERVHVQVGESVAPGTTLVTISCLDVTASAVVNTPRKFALSISQVEPSQLRINNQNVPVFPNYISSVATDGLLYSIIYSIPETALKNITEEGYIPIEVPIAFSDTTQSTPFIPIDSVYQSQNAAYVNVVQGDTVAAKEIKLGTVYGRYAEVESGLSMGDKVILDRNVISGERISISSEQSSQSTTQ
jgi:multidrug efflux pump subunit AcrA (membrane-fusion protein)